MRKIIERPVPNSNTQIYCIFGNPVKHSLSPIMHNAAFRSLNINAAYLAFEVDSIKNAISAMRSLKINGASITIPFKIEAMKYVDNIDKLAVEIGSINTLHNVDGKITGYNTDGHGALNAIIDHKVKIKNASVLILGNGGSARSIAFTLLNEGAGITIAGRNKEKVLSLVNDIKRAGKNAEHTLINDLNNDFMSNIDIIINTTSVGMMPKADISPLGKDMLSTKHTVFDIVYSPDITRLLSYGKELGCGVIRGIEMLINQGAKQFEIWTGRKAPLKAIEKALAEQIRIATHYKE